MGMLLRTGWLLVLLVALCIILAPRACYAQKVGIVADDQTVILCIVGEAEDQGYEGMRAIAHGIRNRGMLKGVYGCKAPRVRRRLYSKNAYLQAEKAWKDSLSGKDVTFGADHWENIKQFGKPYWVSGMKETVKVKDHVFYRKAL